VARHLARIELGGAWLPGVTTTALALVWLRYVIVAEQDPVGRAGLAGMWRGQAVGDGKGLLRFALAAQREAHAAGQTICAGAVPLENGAATRLVLLSPPRPLLAR
jgi:hypothetical protein